QRTAAAAARDPRRGRLVGRDGRGLPRRLSEEGGMTAGAGDFYALHRHGFVRVATCTPRVRPADVAFNRHAIIAEARRAAAAGADLAVFPELSVSSYAIDDLHLQAALLDAVEAAVDGIVAASADLSPILLIGAPLRHGGRLYNCALAVSRGA